MKALLFIFVCFPVLSFGFSETELDSLSSKGTTKLSSRNWRLELGASLSRNLEFNSLYGEGVMKNLFDPKKDTSLLDFSNLYYSLSVEFNYSLSKLKSPFNFIKNIELFTWTRFRSPFSGYYSDLNDYGVQKYLHYAIGDLWAGMFFPTFKKEKWLSYSSLSFIFWPLNRFSQTATLVTSADAEISFLYFIIKNPSSSFSVSSNHSLAYHYFKKKSADKTGNQKNIPLDSQQTISLIYRQKDSQYIPYSISLYSSHYLGYNSYKTWLYDLKIGTSASWKIKKQLFLNVSIAWKDRVLRYNKTREVHPAKPYFNLSRLVTSLGLYYAF